MTPNEDQPKDKKLPNTHPAVRGKKKTDAAIKRLKKKPAGTAVAIDDPAKRQQVAQQQSQPDSFLAVVMKAAMDPKCDPAKMHSLLDFQERLKNAEAKEAFDDALVALQAELPSITRDRKIEVRAKDPRTGERTGALQQSTPYATFEAIHEAIQPLLTKYGFGLSFSTAPVGGPDGRLEVKTTLFRKGHSISTSFPLPADTSGSKNNAQGWGSAQSYGKRYGTIAILNIVSHAPEDQDTDARTGNFVRSKDGLTEKVEPEMLTEEEVAALNQKMIACKVPLAKVLDHYGIKALSEIPRSVFQTALRQCEDYADNQKRKQQDFPGDKISTGGQRGR